MRALASYLCTFDSRYGLSLPLVHAFLLGVSLRVLYSGFPPSRKKTVFKFQFDLDRGPDREPAMATAASCPNIVIFPKICKISPTCKKGSKCQVWYKSLRF